LDEVPKGFIYGICVRGFRLGFSIGVLRKGVYGSCGSFWLFLVIVPIILFSGFGEGSSFVVPGPSLLASGTRFTACHSVYVCVAYPPLSHA